jgi:magnesium transporter
MPKRIRNLIKKVGLPPGTPIYTGEIKVATPRITVVNYSQESFEKSICSSLQECQSFIKTTGTTWINIEGLHDVDLIKQVAEQFHIHPLTVEDILNVEQRSKVDEFEDYCYISLRILYWLPELKDFANEQLSIVFNNQFIISFEENKTQFFNPLYQQLGIKSGRLRQQGSDYLVYRLVDTMVDQYFVVLEGLSEQLETLEDIIISEPSPKNSRTIYALKRKVLVLRKAIWPIREAINRLLHSEIEFITPFTHIYLRDVYDHTIQAIDTLESFRDMLTGLLDVYLSSVSNRLNEVMKVLTIIATIFIPITFIASIYGMNFKKMPELDYPWGYPIVLLVMLIIAVLELIYFRLKKWL